MLDVKYSGLQDDRRSSTIGRGLYKVTSDRLDWYIHVFLSNECGQGKILHFIKHEDECNSSITSCACLNHGHTIIISVWGM